jgi:hypothetical protein
MMARGGRRSTADEEERWLRVGGAVAGGAGRCQDRGWSASGAPGIVGKEPAVIAVAVAAQLLMARGG